ncbi:site-specific integrase [Kozakia baliensis]|uniref:site-specific integrase n=1 Tax=Kozakia baliensis TaxID=153496 RepID=UPI0012689A3D|nr:site-specific integrase [Kozakia baliensis]
MAAGTWVQDGPEDDPYDVLLVVGPDGEPQIAQVSLTPAQLRDRLDRLRDNMTAGQEAGNAQALSTAQAQIDRLLHIASTLAAGTAAVPAPSSSPPLNPLSPEIKGVLYSEAMQTYYDGKKSDFRNDRDARGLHGNLILFLEICGNKPVPVYTGKDAAHFIDTVRRLPKTYGKGKSVSALDAIAIADASAARGNDFDRISETTIEKKVTYLRGLWEWMLPREMAAKNIWTGFKFKTETVNKRTDWTEENLLRLLSSPLDTRTISRRTYAYATALGAYTGMRLGEICHLRPDDVVRLNDGWFILIQEHEPIEFRGAKVAFSPKTEAGERAVPVHPELVRLGFIREVEKMRKTGLPFIFSDLTPRGRDNLLSPRFEQAFSRHKISAGVTPENTFHSFRHSVSTILRNEDATIREVWIDAVLGHTGHASRLSMGAQTYLHKIGPRNLVKTVRRIQYPESIDFSRLFDGLSGH